MALEWKMALNITLNERKFMEQPGLWPRWPLLPLKRGGGSETQCGFLIAQEGILYNVYIASIFSLSSGWKPANAEHVPYASFDELIADGWRID